VPDTDEIEAAALRELVLGAELYSVQFVRDYVQLWFHGSSLDNSLTAYSLPIVSDSRGRYGWDDERYGNRLRSLIDHTVTLAEIIPDKELRLQFDNEMEVSIPLDGSSYTGPEPWFLQSF